MGLGVPARQLPAPAAHATLENRTAEGPGATMTPARNVHCPIKCANRNARGSALTIGCLRSTAIVRRNDKPDERRGARCRKPDVLPLGEHRAQPGFQRLLRDPGLASAAVDDIPFLHSLASLVPQPVAGATRAPATAI